MKQGTVTNPWYVKTIRKHSEGSETGSHRVQRSCRPHDDRCSGHDVAFVHESTELCERVAHVLNTWEAEMSDVKDLFYHGIRQQIKRVLTAMGPDRIRDGISAFETGASNWSACFFARAYPEVNLNFGNPEEIIAEKLGMKGNKVPMRIVYHTFDGMNITMTKKGLLQFCNAFIDEQREPEMQSAIEDVLKSIDYKGAEEKAIDFTVCAVTQAGGELPWAERPEDN